MTEAAQTFWNIISNWKPNQWMIFFGILGVFFFGSSGVSLVVAGQQFGFVPAESQALTGMGMSFAIALLGAWYAREAARFASIERSKAGRSKVPTSELSLAFARQITNPISAEEIDSIPLLEVDQLKDEVALRRSLKRLRLREAAGDQSTTYYEEGLYYPRHSEVTVFDNERR